MQFLRQAQPLLSESANRDFSQVAVSRSSVTGPVIRSKCLDCGNSRNHPSSVLLIDLA